MRMLPTVVGFLATCAGLAMTLGLGWALVIGGFVLFVSGAISEQKT